MMWRAAVVARVHELVDELRELDPDPHTWVEEVVDTVLDWVDADRFDVLERTDDDTSDYDDPGEPEHDPDDGR